MSKVMQKPSLLASHAEVAYNAIEEMIVTLELAPGKASPSKLYVHGWKWGGHRYVRLCFA